MVDGILPDPGSIQRSWHTRMASVMRQFEKLTEDPVTDDNGESIMVIGLCRTVSGIRLTVSPEAGPAHVYSTDLDRLLP